MLNFLSLETYWAELDIKLLRNLGKKKLFMQPFLLAVTEDTAEDAELGVFFFFDEGCWDGV